MASDTHFRALRLGVGRQSFVRWAKEPHGKALIFVNGFGGSPKGTWPDFPQLLAERVEAAGWDLFFFGYHALRARVAASSDEFASFIMELGGKPAGIINATLRPELHRDTTFQYQSLVVVAHSLGAVVTRQALIELDEERDNHWLSKVSLILFAPAHMGADVVPLGTEVLKASFHLAVVQIASNLLIPVWRDLPPDSQTIRELSARTRAALEFADREGKPTGHLIAKKVIFGNLENIVNQDQFCRDPRPHRIPGLGHFSVCKPKPTALAPLLALVECI